MRRPAYAAAMWTELPGSYALPEDPMLADAAASLRDTGHWGFVVDDQWNLVYVTDELRLTFGGGDLAEFVIGAHWYGPENVEASTRWRFGANTEGTWRASFAGLVPFMLTDAPGGRDELLSVVDSAFHDLIPAGLEPDAREMAAVHSRGTALDGAVVVPMVFSRLRDSTGRRVGSTVISKPEAGMNTISNMTSMGDIRHLDRMTLVARAERRPAAILFADLEGSSQLARRLPTSTYFGLGRRLVRAADRAVIDAGGIVGRHVGDGVVAFFVAENFASESDAALGAIAAARALRSAVDDVAVRSGLEASDVVLRFGLHWGSTLFVGSIATAGRTEVTALGDEVNECARIEACATGGRALASKDLIERLSAEAANELELDAGRLTYITLSDLPTATEKARRDAPAIAVCDV